MMKSRFVLAAGAVILARVVAAQPSTEPAEVRKDTLFYVANGSAVMPLGGQVDVIRGEGSVIGGVVKDKPFSASSITESAQLLADGNRIVNRNEAKFYRDAQGRTRREQTLGGLGVWQTPNEPPTMITINDPVADVSYFVDPQRRVARQLQPFRLALDGDAGWTSAMPVPPPPSGVGGPIAGARVLVGRGAASAGVARPIDPASGEPATFDVALPPPGPGVPMTAVSGTLSSVGLGMGPEPAMASFTTAAFGMPYGEPVVDDLGEQVLEGVLAHGTRRTQTIPAGTIGNERAIDVVAEEWYSKDIEAVVLRRNADPRFGETTYKLVGLVRGEPSPELFAVPSGYELKSDFQLGAPRVELRSFGRNGEEGASVGGEPAPPPGARVERRVFLVQPEASAVPPP